MQSHVRLVTYRRGKKCYQKAYDLDPNNEEAGAALCDMMAALGEEVSMHLEVFVAVDIRTFL